MEFQQDHLVSKSNNIQGTLINVTDELKVMVTLINVTYELKVLYFVHVALSLRIFAEIALSPSFPKSQIF